MCQVLNHEFGNSDIDTLQHNVDAGFRGSHRQVLYPHISRLEKRNKQSKICSLRCLRTVASEEGTPVAHTASIVPSCHAWWILDSSVIRGPCLLSGHLFSSIRRLRVFFLSFCKRALLQHNASMDTARNTNLVHRQKVVRFRPYFLSRDSTIRVDFPKVVL